LTYDHTRGALRPLPALAALVCAAGLLAGPAAAPAAAGDAGPDEPAAAATTDSAATAPEDASAGAAAADPAAAEAAETAADAEAEMAANGQQPGPADGPLRVIVVLDVPPGPEGRPERAAIARVQKALLAEAEAAGVALGEVRSYTFLPALAATVSSEALAFLVNAPQVRAIEPDRELKPLSGGADSGGTTFR
jgi:hypothetical protein